MAQVIIVMGSATDRPTAQKAEKILEIAFAVWLTSMIKMLFM